MSPNPLSRVPKSQVPTHTPQCPCPLVPVPVLYTAATQRKAVMGVKGHSIFAKLLYPFDLIRSFAIDWMHSVCLGVVKYIMQLQMSDRNRDKPFYPGAKKASMSHQLLSRCWRKTAQNIRRSETLESHRTEELTIALFSGRFEKQIKCTVCFSLVFACRRDRNFVFLLNIP